MIKHLNIKIFGKVQGVSFRYNSKIKANQLGVLGFVKNQPDGTVYAEIEGEEDNLKEFLLWCQQGPSWAKVIDFQTEEGQFKNFTDFKIEY
ncbi:acylphosphatase [bacterium]|nr:acylphosphatase [bacterium]